MPAVFAEFKLQIYRKKVAKLNFPLFVLKFLFEFLKVKSTISFPRKISLKLLRKPMGPVNSFCFVLKKQKNWKYLKTATDYNPNYEKID